LLQIATIHRSLLQYQKMQKIPTAKEKQPSICFADATGENTLPGALILAFIIKF
jgi:hypothetical protein